MLCSHPAAFWACSVQPKRRNVPKIKCFYRFRADCYLQHQFVNAFQTVKCRRSPLGLSLLSFYVLWGVADENGQKASNHQAKIDISCSMHKANESSAEYRHELNSFWFQSLYIKTSLFNGGGPLLWLVETCQSGGSSGLEGSGGAWSPSKALWVIALPPLTCDAPIQPLGGSQNRIRGGLLIIQILFAKKGSWELSVREDKKGGQVASSSSSSSSKHPAASLRRKRTILIWCQFLWHTGLSQSPFTHAGGSSSCVPVSRERLDPWRWQQQQKLKVISQYSQ